MELANGKEEKWIKHYSSSHKILLVGEGDFSFAACLAQTFGSAVNMVATSLDSKESLLIKYGSNWIKNMAELEDLGCTIFHEVDACTMWHDHRLLRFKFNSFDRIVFNFPHAGFIYPEHSSHQIELHQNVVKRFLKSACGMLTSSGEVHVTHKTAYPFSKWEIGNLAAEVGLCLVGEEPFSRYDYPGYENKRGDGWRSDDSFPVGQASTFKFAQY